MKATNATKTNKATRTEILSLLSIADRKGKLDTAIRNLPAANFYAMKTPEYYRIQKANKMAEEAAKMRSEALAGLADQLLSQTDGWTLEELATAATAAIDGQ